VAAATHGGATYFLGPGQGISSLSHAFGSPGGRNESRSVRGQHSSPAGTVPFGSRFIPDQLREELRRRHSLFHAQLDPEQDLVDLPEMVQRFHSLYPLEDVNREDEIPSTAFGVRTMIFKGISSSDGQAYAIRRIDSRQVIPTAELATTAVEAVERWAPFARHPHIAAIRESFVSREVEDTAALFFVHDYYPAAFTLQAFHLQQDQASAVVHLTANEEQLWSYLVQLATVLRSVHGAGLYFRPGGLHPSKIILTSKGRIRVSGVGILDVLHGDPADDPRIFQREDLAGCGRLILALACGSTANASLEFMGSHYSSDLVRITQALLASSPDKPEGGGISSIRQLHNVLADRMFSEIENVHMQNDEMMNELSKETENGRLLRILVKLGMMNERPENDMDPGWSETGDRYLLKLFRDFVFHQTSEEGTPVIDWGHIIECLNKLDAGVPEKIILMSRDERSLLVASYQDLKRCLEQVYQELLLRASGGDKARQALLMQSPGRLSQR
jgi:PAB-dependent poly(A)-specific ribonuclease subunit 3